MRYAIPTEAKIDNSVTKKIMRYAIPTEAKIDNSVTKKIFPYFIIMRETSYNWVSYYYAINGVMVNEETVIAVNSKLSLIYHDNHYKRVLQICNQYL